jgi:hypothetical protein
VIEVSHGSARIALDGSEARRLQTGPSTMIYNADDLLAATAAALRAAGDDRARSVTELVRPESR